MEAILADKLTKRYAQTGVLDAASLAVPAGGRVVVLGPTGSGKTTLLLVIAGLVMPDSGTVKLFGESASGNGRFLPPEERSIGMVFQRPLLWPHMSVLANVEFALSIAALSRREKRDRATDALRFFGVAELAKRKPETLSGGQAQRVALARSIVSGPRILLWDEPFTGLDAATRSDLSAKIRGWLGSTGTTLVAVSHHADEADALGAVCVRIEGGRIVG